MHERRPWSFALARVLATCSSLINAKYEHLFVLYQHEDAGAWLPQGPLGIQQPTLRSI